MNTLFLIFYLLISAKYDTNNGGVFLIVFHKRTMFALAVLSLCAA